jgi:hypothetical protein
MEGKDKVLCRAVREYAVRTLAEGRTGLSQQEILTVVNCFMKHESVEKCADLTGIELSMIEIMYCSLGIEIMRTAYAGMNVNCLPLRNESLRI